MPEPVVDDSIAVDSSADSTMEEPKVEAPSEPTKTETPAEVVEAVKPTEPVKEAELYELPDGRKVDGVTLSKEWKENFLPEFTRKSQELAKVNKPEILKDNKPTDPLKNPEYIPQTYDELAAQIEARTLARLESMQAERVQKEQEIESGVLNELTELKKLDPTLNENELFVHALKYGFKDLKLAHQNKKDMSELAKKVQVQTAQNIAKRVDPVSTTPGAGGQTLNPDNFASAVDYLRALKASGK